MNNGNSEPAQEITRIQNKLILNLINLFSISAISIMKTFVLPAFMPVLATNPVLLLVFAVLSLAITLATHFLGQQWGCEQQPKVPEPEGQSMPGCKKTQMGFFKQPNRLEGQCEVNVGPLPDVELQIEDTFQGC